MNKYFYLEIKQEFLLITYLQVETIFSKAFSCVKEFINLLKQSNYSMYLCQ